MAGCWLATWLVGCAGWQGEQVLPVSVAALAGWLAGCWLAGLLVGWMADENMKKMVLSVEPTILEGADFLKWLYRVVKPF